MKKNQKSSLPPLYPSSLSSYISNNYNSLVFEKIPSLFDRQKIKQLKQLKISLLLHPHINIKRKHKFAPFYDRPLKENRKEGQGLGFGLEGLEPEFREKIKKAWGKEGLDTHGLVRAICKTNVLGV